MPIVGYEEQSVHLVMWLDDLKLCTFLFIMLCFQKQLLKNRALLWQNFEKWNFVKIERWNHLAELNNPGQRK